MSLQLQQEIDVTNRAFERAVSLRDMSGLDAVYTVGARILPPGGEMVSGREGIRQFWQTAVAALDVASVQLETVEFHATGDTGYEIGRATLHFAAAGAEAAHAKYVVIWKREEGGWKWDVDIWNPNV